MSATETHSVASWGQSLSGAGVCATEGWARWRGGASRKLERTGRRQLESWCGHLNNVALVPEVDGIARWNCGFCRPVRYACGTGQLRSSTTRCRGWNPSGEWTTGGPQRIPGPRCDIALPATEA